MSAVVGTNSYVSVSDADSYFADRFGYDAWQAETNKDGALVSAAAILDSQCKWFGEKVVATQPLAFPRTPGADPVPKEIKDAQCEIAFNISKTGSTVQRSTTEKGALKSLKAQGDLEWYENKGTVNLLVSDIASRLLSTYGLCIGGGSTRIIPIARQ